MTYIGEPDLSKRKAEALERIAKALEGIEAQMKPAIRGSFRAEVAQFEAVMQDAGAAIDSVADKASLGPDMP